jgi:hypothetical protein
MSMSNEPDLARRVARLVDQALVQALTRAPEGATGTMRVARAAPATAPARLASGHPGGPAARRKAQALYEQCLGHYRAVVRAADAARPYDDAGAALAAFVAANLLALHGVTATPLQQLQIERQIAPIVRSSADWQKAALAERQGWFEELAIVAVLVSEAALQAPQQGAAAVEHVRRAARGYLQQLLGLDPDRLALGPDGLTVPAPARAAA